MGFFSHIIYIVKFILGVQRWLPIYYNFLYHCNMIVKVAQLCPTLCDPMDYIVYGIFQARILEWVAFPFSRGSSQPRDQIQVSRIAGRFFTWAAPLEVWKVKAKITQSCPTLCDPMDYIVHGILQARILEWVAVSFSWGSSQPRDWTQVSRVAGGCFCPH